MEPSDSFSQITFQLFALGTLDFSSDSEAISEPHIANSVIFQVIWSLGPHKPHPF